MGIRINGLNIGQIRFNGTNIASVKAGGAIRWLSSVAPVTKYSSTVPKLNASTSFNALYAGTTGQVNGGEYLVTVGGYDGTNVRQNAQAYSSQLVATTLTSLSGGGYFPVGGTNGLHAVIAEGATATNSSSITGAASVYDASLVRSTVSGVVGTANSRSQFARIGNKALFAGGRYMSAGDTRPEVYTLDSSLVKGNLTALTTGRTAAASMSVGGGALFVGGYSYAGSMSVALTAEYYNSSLVKSSWTSLPEAMSPVVGANIQYGATVGGYAVLAGGINPSTNVYTTNAYAYDSNGVQSQLTSIAWGAKYINSLTMANHAVFAGGRNSTSVAFTNVVSYNPQLVQETLTPLGVARGYMAAGVAGRYGILAGGMPLSGFSDAVDAYMD